MTAGWAVNVQLKGWQALHLRQTPVQMGIQSAWWYWLCRSLFIYLTHCDTIARFHLRVSDLSMVNDYGISAGPIALGPPYGFGELGVRVRQE